MELAIYLEQQRQRINNALKEYLPPENASPAQIHKAMHYSVFAGGKRLRPILAIAAYEACGGLGDAILPVACAIELVHTYSLIHDDLPAMDDDDLRRGKPTNHKVFGEATAILTGDALLTYAFELIAKVVELEPHSVSILSKIVTKVSRAAGTFGMIGGQVLDLEAENKKLAVEDVRRIHDLKTSRMIALPITLGSMLARSDENIVSQMEQVGLKLGLAFQIVDDILDVRGSDENFGKPVGSDHEKNKSTYPETIGIERSLKCAEKLIADAEAMLAGIPLATGKIEKIADFIINRKH